MLRIVSELQAQTREAYEDAIMDKIDKASRETKCATEVSNEEVPDWLMDKLLTYGYSVEKGIHKSIIFWGVGDVK